MSHTNQCPSDRLAELLKDDPNFDNLTNAALESHLEECSRCQQRLESLAAGEHYWSRVSRHLPDSGELLAAGRDRQFSLSKTVEVRVEPTPADEVLVSGKVIRKEQTLVSDPLNSEALISDTQYLAPPTHPEMLGRIDEFEIEKVIGRGGMAIVYKGYERELNRPVAIKVLAAHLSASGIARQRFAREAKAAAAVVHPNVVTIHGVRSFRDRPYIVMTLVGGCSLETHVQKNGPLELKEIVRIGKQIAAGLHEAHRQGLVHRDIKPANIMLSHDVNRVLITDFGLARAADDAAITQTGWLAGTPHYMSPEQAKGNEVDSRSDLFSLGSVLYFLATGREPFRAEKPFAVLQQIISEQPRRMRSLNPEVPATLANTVDRLLEKEVEHRFQSAEDVEQHLEKYLAYLHSPETQPEPLVQLRRRPIHFAWTNVGIPIAIALLMLIGLAGFVMTRPGQPNPAQPGASRIPNSAAASALIDFGISFDQFDAEIQSLTEDVSAMEQQFSPGTSDYRQRVPLEFGAEEASDAGSGLIPLHPTDSETIRELPKQPYDSMPVRDLPPHPASRNKSAEPFNNHSNQRQGDKK